MKWSISVVIPVFNRGRTLARALRSVAAQNFTDFEVVVVDDGSTDDIKRVVDEAGLPHVRFLRHDRNLGAAAARNSGVAASECQYIAFLDSDDTWYPSKLGRQIDLLRHVGPQFKACATGFRVLRRRGSTDVFATTPIGKFRSEILLGCTISPGSTLMVERDAFKHVGPFDNSLKRLEDWDWLLRYTELYDMAFVQDILADVDQTRGGQPGLASYETSVQDAVRQIESTHGARIASRGRFSASRFQSGLQIELAAAQYKTGNPWRAANHVVLAFLNYPFRSLFFFRSACNAIRSVLLDGRV